MAFLNPVHALVVPFLCLFTFPLAIFAGITSALAFSLLMFRVAIVYVDIAMAFVPNFIKGRHYNNSLTETELTYSRRLSASSRGSSYASSRRGSADNSPPPGFVSPSPYYQSGYDSHQQRSPLRRKTSYGFGAIRRSRRSSQASISPTIISIREDFGVVPPLPKSGGLAPSVGIERDFEGVGGWRLNDDDNDDVWENINSRLELPMERYSSFGGRSHTLSHRSHSAGPSQALEGGGGRMGNTSRKGTLRNGSGSGSGYGGGEAQANWVNGNGSASRVNRSASGSISKALALTPSGGGRNYHHHANGPSPMGLLEQEQGYFSGSSGQNGKRRPMS
ncbi:hypothetical protein B0T20DRAFT_411828 [Sordaria brevicollis]|uniref:Uncharacterized protein n=1 Tax=Sordaria brevicollis TaxID=83679 RepID=A0AAE0PEX9_SORBR|nr:hypothetical protein B0T20DRAFT_411828 [Sordaria brevicollis]